jgi:hypothetical protein
LLPPLGNETLVAEPPTAPPLALLVIGSRPPDATPLLVDEPPMFCVAPPLGVADAEPVPTWPPWALVKIGTLPPEPAELADGLLPQPVISMKTQDETATCREFMAGTESNCRLSSKIVSKFRRFGALECRCSSGVLSAG